MGVSLIHPKNVCIFAAVVLLFVSQSASAASVSATGYYRTRGEFVQNADMQKNDPNMAHNNHRFGLVAFNQMRLRVQPMLKLNDNLSMHAEFDVLDNVVFGTKDTQQLEVNNSVVGTITMPAGATSISMTGGEAGTNKALNVRRVYMDILTPVGKLRIGRQPSHWGLGIFQNDGEEIQGDFGDSADRLLFLSGYDFDNGASFTGGLLWDIAFSSQYDPTTEGLAGAVSSYAKGTQQYGLVLLYNSDNVEAGMFGGFRWRRSGHGTTMTATNAVGGNVPAGIDGNTNVYFADLYARYSYREYDFKFEGVYLGGKISTGAAINAIPFSVYNGISPSTTGTAGGIIELPYDQDLQVFMAAFEASGAYKWGGEWNFKAGLAEGDATPLSQRITQYGFRPDYQIALLMFHVPLGTSPSLWGPQACSSPPCPTTNVKLSGGVPITGNNINNAIYASAGYKHHFDIRDAMKDCNDLAIGAQITTAWAQKDPVSLNFQELLGNNTLPVLQNSHKWYGIEIDVSAQAEFWEHLYTALDLGVLIPGAAYDIRVNENTLGPLVETIPTSKAQIAYGGRLTAVLKF